MDADSYRIAGRGRLVLKLSAAAGGIVVLLLFLELFLQTRAAEQAPKHAYVTNLVEVGTLPPSRTDSTPATNAVALPRPVFVAVVRKVRVKPQEVTFRGAMSLERLRQLLGLAPESDTGAPAPGSTASPPGQQASTSPSGSDPGNASSSGPSPGGPVPATPLPPRSTPGEPRPGVLTLSLPN